MKYIFLPGFMCDERLFQPQMIKLKSSGYDCSFFAPDTQASIPEMARDILSSYIGPVFIIGLSMGGIIALEIALQAPKRVKGLAILNSTPFEDSLGEHRLEQIEQVHKEGIEGLESMSMEDYFHPNLKWYGPGGIGACMGFKEFQERHQAPWLIAFPDREVLGLDNLICDGPICGEAWFQSVEATHGGPYLGVPATGKTVKISSIDYWLRQDDVFTENWIFIDFVELFDQMDYNLLEHARSLQS